MHTKKDKPQKADATEQNKQIEELQTQLQEMTEMAKRAMADMQNMKRRQEEERSQIILRANANLISNLIPVLDNLNRAIKHTPEGAEDWAKGIEMSIKQIQSSFTEAGLAEIEALGQPFNPDLHEALMQGPGEKDLVIEELEKGYMLGSLVLRHSKVKVGTGE
jgi:molecular chaperone GrpE